MHRQKHLLQLMKQPYSVLSEDFQTLRSGDRWAPPLRRAYED